MTFSLHQGGVVMSSQTTHTHTHTVIKIHPLADILDTWALIFSSCSLFIVYPNRIMKLHPSPLHVITTRAREGGPKEHSAKQKWPRETRSVTYVPGLSTLSDLSRIAAQPPPSFLCCLRPPSHHTSSLSSVSLVPVLHWLRSSTPFWPYGTHASILSTCPNHHMANTFHMPNTFQRSPSSLNLIHSVYHITFTSSIGCHLLPLVLKTIHFL